MIEITKDLSGKRIGFLAIILAVFLSVTILAAHQTQVQALVLHQKFNDQWLLYQSKLMRDSQLELNLDLMKLVAIWNPRAPEVIEFYFKKHLQNGKELETIKKEMDAIKMTEAGYQKKILYFDLADVLLGFSFVLMALYFLIRQKVFPFLGLLFGLTGISVGVLGFIGA